MSWRVIARSFPIDGKRYTQMSEWHETLQSATEGFAAHQHLPWYSVSLEHVREIVVPLYEPDAQLDLFSENGREER